MLKNIRGLQADLRKARRIALVGIGSDLRGDDAAGLLVIRELRSASGRGYPSAAGRMRLFEGGTAPENLTGALRRCKPSLVLLIDAADMGLKPGAARLIDPESTRGISFSTHALPLSILASYLRVALSGPARRGQSHLSDGGLMILGIQPEKTDFGRTPSSAVVRAARRVAHFLRRALLKPMRASMQRRVIGGRES